MVTKLELLKIIMGIVCPDRRPPHEVKRERAFIEAANSLKTLRVTPEGGMSIDPEEFREQIIASREQLKNLVHKSGTPSRPFNLVAGHEMEQEASPAVEAPVSAMDCIEVVAWRRLPSGAAVRYTCLQCVITGRFAVAAASLFSEWTESLPPWVDGNTNSQVACALQSSELDWYATVGEAMDAWDVAL